PVGVASGGGSRGRPTVDQGLRCEPLPIGRPTLHGASMSATPTRDQILERLRRVKGPDLEGNIVDLGLVSEILLKDGRVFFCTTGPVEGARELEPMRQAAEKLVRDIEGITGVAAVLTAEKPQGSASAAPRGGPRAGSPRGRDAR